MTNKLNTYSQQYYSFIKANMKINNLNHCDKLVAYYNTIKSVNKQSINTSAIITLNPLRDQNDNYLVMDGLKQIDQHVLKKHIQGFVGKNETNKLLHYLNTNDKDKFASWIILYHRLISPMETIKNNFYTTSHDRVNLHTLLYDNPFVSLNIQNYYETHSTIYSNYKHNGVILHLYEYTTMPKINPIDVFHIVDIMKTLSKKNINIKIVILGSPFKKKLFNATENNDKTILPIHVNSGSTLHDSYINIWRYEEWQKVLIHEMIHYLSIDFNSRTPGFNNLVTYLDNKFNVDGRIIPSEAYTELVAVVLHTMYISNSFKKFAENFSYEQNFSLFQVAKILNYIGANNLDDIDKVINPNTKIILKQNSSILSYSIIILII